MQLRLGWKPESHGRPGCSAPCLGPRPKAHCSSPPVKGGASPRAREALCLYLFSRVIWLHHGDKTTNPRKSQRYFSPSGETQKYHMKNESLKSVRPGRGKTDPQIVRGRPDFSPHPGGSCRTPSVGGGSGPRGPSSLRRRELKAQPQFSSASGGNMPPLKGCWEGPRWWRHPSSSTGLGSTDRVAGEQTRPVSHGANHIPMCRDFGPLSTEAGPDLVWLQGVPKEHKIAEVSRLLRTKGGGPGKGARQLGAGRVQRPRGGTGLREGAAAVGAGGRAL